MIAVDETALRCDFLETYHIPDYRALPARQAALFACGLKENARIKLKLSGYPVSLDTMLLAVVADYLAILAWQNTENGAKNRKRPRSILDTLTGGKTTSEGEGFDSAEDFEAWRASMLGGDANA
ncbi:MAG: hypothetical protein IKQ10_03755 [Oscillospiraceae bacterium]|nr:hypothetical protein [Oscillospiraceae bacterium]